MIKLSPMMIAVLLLLPVSVVVAGDTPQEQRQHLMEESKESAKTVGGMLKGQVPFDADKAMAGIKAWAKVAGEFGELFPVGSESGYETEAKAEIWTDREGFDRKLAEFSEAADAAITANPQSLKELGAAADPIFKSCKACHESYRVDND